MTVRIFAELGDDRVEVTEVAAIEDAPLAHGPRSCIYLNSGATFYVLLAPDEVLAKMHAATQTDPAQRVTGVTLRNAGRHAT